MQRALYLYECNVPSTQHSNATLMDLLFLLCNFCTDRYIFSNMFTVQKLGHFHVNLPARFSMILVNSVKYV